METVILVATGALLSGLLSVAAYVWRQGDIELVVDESSVRDAWARITGNQMTVGCVVDVRNRGRQDAFLLDVFCQPLYPGPVLEQLEILCQVRQALPEPRRDWYWQAMILGKRRSCSLEIRVKINCRTSPKLLLTKLSELVLVIHLKAVGRRQIEYSLGEVLLDLVRLSSSSQKAG
ncbi:MAG: hypothetical protein HYY08_00815 [Firmicutes bacterium]|nr:hypothetical protein [Bacillota bacterium]